MASGLRLELRKVRYLGFCSTSFPFTPHLKLLHIRFRQPSYYLTKMNELVRKTHW
jgi:hypothetical protein